MITFSLLNFGCRASQAEGAAMKRQLLEAGFHEQSTVAQSDVAVINTCTVTATADAEARQIIRRIHRENPGCRILVTGCYAQRAPREIARMEGVAWVVGNSHKHVIAERLAADFGLGVSRSDCPPPPSPGDVCAQAEPSQRIQIQPAPAPGSPGLHPMGHSPSPACLLVEEPAPQFHFVPAYPDDRTRPTLKVQDGCNARCAFCIIPSVRGRSRSLAPATVVAQVNELVEAGYKEVVLSGINLGSFGRDLDPRVTFLGLLETILRETRLPRLRISSIEPMDVTRELIELIASEPRIARHLHVPLQSGCDRTLRAMYRRYWAWQYAERIAAIREALPEAGIGADVMVGFPGETEADHQSSVSFIDSIPFTYLHIFPYSARPSTSASARSDHVKGEVARRRAEELRSVMAVKRASFLAGQVGRKVSALTLSNGLASGGVALSTNYLKIQLSGPRFEPNHLLPISIDRVEGNILWGHVAE